MSRSLLPALLAAALLAGCGHDSSYSVCLPVGDVTAPSPLDVAPRRHGTVTRDSTWPGALVDSVAAMRADTTVQIQLVHATAVVQSDRDFVVANGGTVAAEDPDENAIIATFTVAALRSWVPGSATTRIIDAHLVRDRVIPPCRA